MKNQPEMPRRFAVWGRVAAAMALALCLSAGIQAQEQQEQGQNPQPQAQGQDNAAPPPQAQEESQGQPPAQAQDQPQKPQDAKPKPVYASQDADKPPYSHDKPRQNAPTAQRSSNSQVAVNQPQASERQAPATSQLNQAAAPLPSTLTVPAGTILTVRINDFLSSDKNQIGDHFTAVLERPIVVNGWVVARRGETLVGQVKEAKKAGRVKGVSQLGVELTDMTVVDGRQAPILTELWKGSAGTSHGLDAATIGGETALGAAIGAAADWGRGAAIGAGAGAAAGIATVLLTRGRPTELFPETQLSFRLQDSVTIDTTQAQQAFLPVTQKDYDGGARNRPRPRLAGGYPGPWGYPCGYNGPCYAYPGYVGFYGWPGYYRGYYWRP